MFVFLLVILALAALLEYLSLRGGSACAEVKLRFTKTCVEPGESCEMITEVKNIGRLPISYLCVSVAFPLTTVFPENADRQHDMYNAYLLDVFRLWMHQKVTHTMQFSLEERGVHKIQGSDVRRGDFLGIRNVTGHLSQYREILVFPKRLDRPAFLEALGNYFGEQSAKRWLLRDPILTAGVREYTGTEPMRTILWNQTARRGELMVREFDYSRSLNCDVLLCTDDLFPSEAELLDLCCSAARTVCEELADRGVDIRFYTNAMLAGLKRERVRGCLSSKGKMEDILELLARVTSLPCSPSAGLADACLREYGEATAYVIIAPHPSQTVERLAEDIGHKTGEQPLLIVAESLGEEADADCFETAV